MEKRLVWFSVLLWKSTGKCFFCWHFPLPTSPQTTPVPRPLLSFQLPGCAHAYSGRRGLLLAWIQLEVKEKKPIRKQTFHPSLGTETKGRLCFPSIPAKSLVSLSKPAQSIQPGACQVGGLGRAAQSMPLLHWWDRSFRARHSYIVLSKCLLF